jgi:hypothetical protein
MKITEGTVDFADPTEERLDGVSEFYRVIANIVCIEFYAYRIVDGKIRKVVAMRSMWDRSCWLAAQVMLSRISAEIASMPAPIDRDDELRVH